MNLLKTQGKLPLGYNDEHAGHYGQHEKCMLLHEDHLKGILLRFNKRLAVS